MLIFTFETLFANLLPQIYKNTHIQNRIEQSCICHRLKGDAGDANDDDVEIRGESKHSGHGAYNIKILLEKVTSNYVYAY